MPRVLTSTVITESAKEHLHVIDLVKVVFPQPIGTLYWANSYFTYKGNTYLPRINSVGAWSRTMNPETDDVTLVLGNVDGLITRIHNSCTMELAEVSLIRYYPDIDEAIDPFWVGWGGTIKLNEEDATWKIHFGFRGSTQKGLRKITSNCWKIFGNEKYCPYDGVDIGRSSTLSSAITDLITTTISITDPSLYVKNDIIQIDDEKFLVVTTGTPTTITRGYDGTTPSTHSNGARIYHKSCGKSVQACRRRGMNGPPELENGLRYFGGWINYLPDPFWQRGTPPPGSISMGIPGITFFQQSAVGGPSVQGRVIPAIYGEFRLSNVQAVFTADAREFRHSLFILCEGEIYALAVNSIRSQDKEVDNCPNGYDPYPSEYDLFHNESCMIWYGGIGQRRSHAAWYNVDADQYKKNPYLINDDTTGDGPSLSDVAAVRIRIEEGGEDFSNDLPSMDVSIIGRIVRTIQGWIDDDETQVTQYPDPIEVAVDYLCNGKFGPRWDISRVDLNSAKTCSDYCRELVYTTDEGEVATTQHSRFLFNGALTDDQDVEKQLAFILDNCNGYYIPVGRKMYFGIRKAENLTDVDAEPVLCDFGVTRNIIRANGKSTLEVEDVSSLDGFVNDIETVFADKAYGFQSNTLYIYDDGAQLISAEILGDSTRVDNKKQLKLVGTINKDQAIRLGTLRLRETELQRVKYTFQMSLRDSIKIAPGDVRKLISASADGSDVTRMSAVSQYIRINKIEETDKFLATIEAFKHDNSIYDNATEDAFPPAWGYWKLEEDSGSDKVDSSGNLHTLVETDQDIAKTAAKLGFGSLFPGTSGTLQNLSTIDQAPDFSGNKPFTIPFWFKITRTGAGAALIYFDIGAGAYGVDGAIGLKNGLSLGYIYAQTDDLFAQSSDVITLDVLHHGIIYYDLTGLYITIDGEIVASDLGSSGCIFGISDVDWGGIYPNNIMSFVLDEFGIWVGENALTAAQRSRLFNSGNGWSPY